MRKGISSIPQPEFRAVISKLVELLSKRIEGLRSVVLFGSIARGEAGPCSDVDLVVVSENFPENPSKAADPIIESFLELKSTEEYRRFSAQGRMLTVDPIGYRPSDLESFPPLLLDVSADGIILVDDGFMESVLERLRNKLRRLGARRVKTKRGWYWDLKPDYKFGEVVEYEEQGDGSGFLGGG